MKLDRDRFERAAEEARRYVADGEIPSALLAVADSTETLAVRAYDRDAREAPSLQDGIFCLASISKAITGVGVARLVDQGKLDYQEPVAKRVPEFGTDAQRRKVTLAHVFTHSTGLPNRNVMEFAHGGVSSEESFRMALEDEPLCEPGTHMQYATHTFQLVNAIVFRLLAMNMTSFLQQYVYEPCGMVDTGFEPVDPARAVPVTGHPLDDPEDMARFARTEVSGGGLWSTAADLVRLGQAVLTPGKLMRPETFRLMTQAQPSLPRWNTDQTSCRTLGWVKESQAFFPNQPETGFYHGGASGTLLWLDPASDLVYVFLTNIWCSCNDPAFAVLSCLY